MKKSENKKIKMQQNKTLGTNKKHGVQSIEKRNAQLINLILNFAINNNMSLKEVVNCIKEVARVFYTDGLIKRE